MRKLPEAPVRRIEQLPLYFRDRANILLVAAGLKPTTEVSRYAFSDYGAPSGNVSREWVHSYVPPMRIFSNKGARKILELLSLPCYSYKFDRTFSNEVTSVLDSLGLSYSHPEFITFPLDIRGLFGDDPELELPYGEDGNALEEVFSLVVSSSRADVLKAKNLLNMEDSKFRDEGLGKIFGFPPRSIELYTHKRKLNQTQHKASELPPSEKFLLNFCSHRMEPRDNLAVQQSLELGYKYANAIWELSPSLYQQFYQESPF
jgi:hypothetical protein